MVDSTWAHQQRRDGGWTAFDSEKPRATNWLASIIGAKEELPSHIDQKPSADDVSHRLKGIKRSFLRRLPSAQSLWRRGPRLTDQSRSSVSIPSATTVRFVLLCALWYTTSALSSNTGKSIMTLFRYPVTLTFVQFGFVAGYCLLFMSPLVRFSRLRYPNKAIIQSTFPMGVFQVGGHIFSSMAISRIPVSTVHTIKVSVRVFPSTVVYLTGKSRLSRRYLPSRRTPSYSASATPRRRTFRCCRSHLA